MKYGNLESIRLSKEGMHVAGGAHSALIGALLSLGQPAGWLLLYRLFPSLPYSESLITYLMLSSLALLTLFGYHAGEREAALESMVETDLLTGLYNQTAFFRLTSLFVSLGRRERQPVSVIMMDIDHFKKIVDTEGHLFGNFVLKEIGRLLRRQLRESNIAARFGGDEFVICLPHARAKEAADLAARLREAIAAAHFRKGKQEVQLKMSLGVAEALPSDRTSVAKLVQSADEALFEAKHRGGNRVVVHRDIHLHADSETSIRFMNRRAEKPFPRERLAHS
jgi:diguanylate cyclase (GGDEF)-like protein